MSKNMESGARAPRRLEIRHVVALAAVAVVVAALVPYGATAAGSTLMRLMDGDGTSKAQVDAGKVRVGDGSGPLSVDGSTRPPTSQVLLSGSCNMNGNPYMAEFTQSAGLRITGIFLGPTKTGDATGKLQVTAPGDTEPMFNLLISNGAGFDERHAHLNFGDGGLSDPDTGFVWKFQCATHSGAGAAHGNWIVYGTYP